MQRRKAKKKSGGDNERTKIQSVTEFSHWSPQALQVFRVSDGKNNQNIVVIST